MATRRPLAVVSGAVSEVPSGDTVDPATLPTFVSSVENTDATITVSTTSGVANVKIAQLVLDNITSLLAGKQDADADLTDIAGLSATDGDFLRRVSGHWANLTTAALKTALALAKADVGLGNVDNTSNATERTATATLTNKTLTAPVINSPTGITASDVGAQPLDADLTDLAGLTYTDGDFVRRVSGHFANITTAALKTSLALAKADVGLGSVDNTADSAKPISTLQQTGLDAKQGLDATLTALAGLATGANKLAYSTGTDTFSQTDLTAAGRALIDDADATAQIVTLGLAALYQPLDSDLTALAGISPANDDIVQRKAGAWTNRTIAQLLTDLGLAALYQPLDSDLTTLAGLTPTSGNVVTGNGSAWTSAAPASPAFSTKVETIADSSSLTGNSASGATQVGVTTALTSDAAVNAPSNGTVGAPYRYIITASGGSRTVTPTGFAASTDNGSGAAIVVASGKTVSIFAQYIGSSGWLYGGYELLA